MVGRFEIFILVDGLEMIPQPVPVNLREFGALEQEVLLVYLDNVKVVNEDICAVACVDWVSDVFVN